MTSGDKVVVNWPTGKGGPYEVLGTFEHNSICTINVNGKGCFVDCGWCEVVEPKLEPDRLYYWTIKRDKAGLGKNINTRVWNQPVPVHRRWNELTDDERDAWIEEKCNVSAYHLAYKLITGEDHPQG